MELPKSRVLMMSAPALGAFLLGAVLLGGIVPNTTDKLSEGFNPTGYVTVSVVRDGTEIYHYEDHNLITNAGMDFIAQQLGDTTGLGTNGANYIGLSTNSKATDLTDTCISTTNGGTTSTEITGDGLVRSQGAFAYTATQDLWTITEQFTASGAGHTGVQRAGLFTAAATGDTCAGGDDGIMVAGNSFASVNLASGDQLTITWTIDLGL